MGRVHNGIDDILHGGYKRAVDGITMMRVHWNDG